MKTNIKPPMTSSMLGKVAPGELVVFRGVERMCVALTVMRQNRMLLLLQGGDIGSKFELISEDGIGSEQACYLPAGVEIEVLGSEEFAALPSAEPAHGDLLFAGQDVFIFVKPQRFGSTYIDVRSGQIVDSPKGDRQAYRRWQLVAGGGSESSVLFRQN